MAVQLRAVAETFIARRVKFHDGYTSDGFFPQGAKQPQFTRGQEEDIQFRPVSPSHSPSVFSSVVSRGAANTHLSFKQGERINSCSKIGEDR